MDFDQFWIAFYCAPGRIEATNSSARAYSSKRCMR